jgi:hypothetical protein
MNEELIARLKKLAENTVWLDDEDLCVDDYAGGNIDDAFQGGQNSGQTELAREVLDVLGIEWVKAE